MQGETQTTGMTRTVGDSPLPRVTQINSALWIIVAVTLCSYCITWVNQHIVIPLTPHLIDGTLMRLDHGVGVGIWHFALAHSWFNISFLAIYFSLWLVIPVAIIIRPGMIVPLTLADLLCVPFYLLFPAVGPAHINEALAPRNCMPSMHVCLALLMWVNTRHSKAHTAFGIYAALTVVSTLTTGEHYLPDLVAAVPFALLVNWLAKKMNLAEKVESVLQTTHPVETHRLK